ncbi:hypothetical protein M422DRAFT_257492 [Sphaerobolus stellatus SS14]|uniref:Uncharacterized protein n=1 Tax=Sphaerobolus stellatus (strain SS14) TaxID=990650 RepID=A0A0C9VE26_SPHS4|nr:hypothetical protein M422DRAFT_257492 [Sphaerobolus stellatus SS14]
MTGFKTSIPSKEVADDEDDNNNDNEDPINNECGDQPESEEVVQNIGSQKPSLYDHYEFEKHLVHVLPNGELHTLDIRGTHILYVNSGWAVYKDAMSDGSSASGYLGKGLNKYTFKGYTCHGDFAVFQSILDPTIFLSVFHKWAAHYGITLPKICFNAKGAFLGIIKDWDVPNSPTSGVPDTHSMLYKTFLATPLLHLPPVPQKLHFTDKDRLGDDKTELSQALNKGEFVLYDPQAHTYVIFLLMVDSSSN